MIDGALLLDKPLGLSSNAALQEAKRLFGARKAGHAGTLDPLASGLLIVLFGEATKFAGPLLDDDKEYLATLKLGETHQRPAMPKARLSKRRSNFVPGRTARRPRSWSASGARSSRCRRCIRRSSTTGCRSTARAPGREVEREPRRVRSTELELHRVDSALARAARALQQRHLYPHPGRGYRRSAGQRRASGGAAAHGFGALPDRGGRDAGRAGATRRRSADGSCCRSRAAGDLPRAELDAAAGSALAQRPVP